MSALPSPKELSSNRLKFILLDCFGSELPWPCLRFEDGKEADLTLQSSLGLQIFGETGASSIQLCLRKDMIKRITLGDFTPVVFILLGDVVPGDRTVSDGTCIEFYQYIAYKDDKLTPEQRETRNAAMRQAYAIMELAEAASTVTTEVSLTPPPPSRVSLGPDTVQEQQKKPSENSTSDGKEASEGSVEMTLFSPKDTTLPPRKAAAAVDKEATRVEGTSVDPPSDQDTKSPTLSANAEDNGMSPVDNDENAPRAHDDVPATTPTDTPAKTTSTRFAKITSSSRRRGYKTTTVTHLPEWVDVKDVLARRHGYVFREGYFGDSIKQIADNLTAFRRYLCAKGVRKAKKPSKSKDALVSTWVRYAVCPTLETHREYFVVSSSQLSSMARRLGVTRQLTSPLSPADFYVLPGYSKEQTLHGQGAFAHFDEMCRYLARFGYPDNFAWDALTPTERLSFELGIADSLDLEETFDLDERRVPFPAPRQEAVNSTKPPPSLTKTPPSPLKKTPGSHKRKSSTECAVKYISSYTTPKASPRGGKTKSPRKTPWSSQKKTLTFSKNSIPSFDDVRPILLKHGYYFDDGVFCRPGTNQARSKTAVDGSDCFDSLKSFREDLCARGLTSQTGIWSDDEKELLSKWVRYSVVKSLDALGDNPKYFQVRDRDLTTMALRVGVHAAMVGHSLLPKEHRYVLPGYGHEQVNQGIGSFSDPREMFEYFSLHGIPRNFDLTKLDDIERLSFELGIADFVEPETCFEFHSCGKVARLPEPEGESYVVSSRKRSAKESSTYANSTKKLKHSSSKSSNKAPSAATEASSSTATVISTDSPARGHAMSIPEHQTTNELKLRSSLEQLQLSAVDSQHLVAVPGSKFAENIAWVESTLKKAISDYELNDLDRPASTIFVGGPPGIGKTAGVRLACAKVTAFAQSSSSLEIPITIHINCSFLRSASNPVPLLAAKLLEELGVKSKSKDPVKSLKMKLKQSPIVILVLDEIDLLVNEYRVDMKRIVGAETALKLVRDLAENHEIGIIPIGVANSTANNRYARLRQILKVETVRFFSAYDAHDITAILKARVGTTIVASNVLSLIAKKVQERSGDARHAFDQLGGAISSRLERLTAEDKASATSGPLVLMKDYMKVLQEETKKVERIIDGFSPGYVAILCVCVALAKEDVKITTLKHLRAFSQACITESHGPEHALRVDDFRIALEIIADSGLLSIALPKECQLSNLSASAMAGLPVRLGLQLEDVEKALSKSLSHGVYQKIRETARGKRNELICCSDR